MVAKGQFAFIIRRAVCMIIFSKDQPQHSVTQKFAVHSWRADGGAGMGECFCKGAAVGKAVTKPRFKPAKIGVSSEPVN